MIKCQVILTGRIPRPGQMRTDKEGKQFLSFGVKVPVKSNTQDQLVEISVSKQLAGAEQPFDFILDRRVIVDGVLTFRRKGDNLYLNFAATEVDLHAGDGKEEISGTMEFRGTVGKQITERTDKKNQPFLMFSAYSAEKIGEEFAYTWVRFMQFHTGKLDWLAEKSYISAKGDLEVSLYNGRPQISCTLTELSPQEKWSPNR